MCKLENKEPEIISEIRDKIISSFNELIFVEEGHKYFLNGEEYDCVSNMTHKFKNPEYIFDTTSQSIKYAQKHGETPEYWREKWKYSNDYANYMGTLCHEYGESKFYEKLGQIDKICSSSKHKFLNGKLTGTNKKELAIDKFWAQLPDNLYPVLCETKVYTSNNNFKKNYAGTFDILFYYESPQGSDKSGLLIYDYKTNINLRNQFQDQMLLSPFDYLPDENLSFYILQTNSYQIPLEDIGLNVIGRRIIYLKEDGQYESIKIPDISKELRLAYSK